MKPNKCVWLLAAAILAAGCAARTVRVRCDAHLQPINPQVVGTQAQSIREGGAKSARGTP